MIEINLAKPIDLNEEQKKALEKLWFIYGNSGPKATKGNHGYIQGFIQYNEDRKEFYLQGEKNMQKRGLSEELINKMKLTEECIEAVDKVLIENQ